MVRMRLPALKTSIPPLKLIKIESMESYAESSDTVWIKSVSAATEISAILVMVANLNIVVIFIQD